MWAPLGLQARVRVVPRFVYVGPVVFTVQVTVREAVAELLQASVAVKVLRSEERRVGKDRGLSGAVTDAVQHVSVAVAVPTAGWICAAIGLQHRATAEPLVVIGG